MKEKRKKKGTQSDFRNRGIDIGGERSMFSFVEKLVDL
jgi:hypothetical protein